jgi:tetratricopeptide (TPR) repeat protein
MDFEPKDHSRRPVLLNNYVSMLGKYGQETKKTEYLDQAIELVRMAISEIPSGDTDWLMARCNLGNLLGQRFRRYLIKEDIDEAISLYEEALSKLPTEHFNRVGCLKGLGVWYSERFERFHDPQDEL